MKNSDEIKQVVKDKYAGIVLAGQPSDCGCCCNETADAGYSVFNESYESRAGYVKEADLGLGCGIPTEFAGIKLGDHVLDLGSGAGNDCFVARALTGETGKVTGLDFTEEMIAKADENKRKLGFSNVEFIQGDIENMPLPDTSYNVVLSNCVLNLVPDKEAAFREIMRVLKEGGRFCISDVVLKGDLPASLKDAAALYAGCVSGALQQEDYLRIIRDSGFEHVEIRKQREIMVPDDMLLPYTSGKTLEAYRRSGAGIYSITVTGKKPSHS